MRWSLAVAIAVAFGALAPAHAQQAGGPQPYRGLGSGTPGVEGGTTGTTYATPGAEQKTGVPGGGIPMGAGTQDSSNLTGEPSNLNNAGGSKKR